MGGRDAFLKMKESKPGVRAIVASGYLEPSIRSEMLKAGVIDTIQKPYDFNDIVANIRSIIGPENDRRRSPGTFLANPGLFRFAISVCPRLRPDGHSPRRGSL